MKLGYQLREPIQNWYTGRKLDSLWNETWDSNLNGIDCINRINAEILVENGTSGNWV